MISRKHFRQQTVLKALSATLAFLLLILTGCKPSSGLQESNQSMVNMRIGKGVPTSLAVSPDGKWMAVSTPFGVYMYATNTFEESWFVPLEEKAGLAIFDGQSERLGVTSGGDILILDVASGDLLVTLENAGDSFAFSPDGMRMVSGGGCLTVTVWDASSGAALKELQGGQCSEGYSGVHVTWTADQRIYAASMGTEILAWDADTYAPIEGFSAEGAKGTWVSALLAAPSGSLFAQYEAMMGQVVTIIDGQQDKQVQLLDNQVNGPLTALAWAPDGQHLAVGYGMGTGLIQVWNVLTGEVDQKLEGFYYTAGLGWSSDGKILYGAQTLDGQIHAIVLSTERVLCSLNGHAPADTFMTWTQDGLASTNGAVLSRWNPENGALKGQEIIGTAQEWVISWPPSGPGTYLFNNLEQTHQVGSLSSKQPLIGDANQSPFSTDWSFDGRRLADPTHVWDAESGALLASLNDPDQRHLPDQVAWSPDGSRLASADSLNMQPPVIWDAQTGQVLLPLQAETGNLDPIWLGLAWSPDGEKLAGVGAMMSSTGEDEGMILVWDAKTGKQEQLLTDGMYAYRLNEVAWSPDGQYLASSVLNNEIVVWDMVNYTLLDNLQGHRDVIDHLAWSNEGDRLASVSRDGTMQIWDLSQFISVH
jgi:WD40 repeat protein